jgi:hypothetical protein
MFRGHERLARLRELRLPAPERQAARSERAAEAQIRRERDNQYTAERRAAAMQAEADRYKYHGGRP